MKSESKKFEPKPVEVKREWLISYEIYRVTTAITTRVDVGTRIVEASTLRKAYESMKIENNKVVITNVFEL